MISGATLLRKQEPLSDFFKKRLSKLAIPLIFWSCFYLWWLYYNGVEIGNWALRIISGPTMYHLWFFYTLIGLYLFVPIMRRFYQASTRAEKLFFMIIWFFVASIIPTIQSLFEDSQCGWLKPGILVNVYSLQYLGGYLGYMFLGAFLIDRKNSIGQGIGVYVAASSGTALLTYLLSKKLGTPCEFFYLYLSPLVVAASTGLFIAFNAAQPATSGAAVGWIANSTLGIYCLHPFIIDPVFMSRGFTSLTGSGWVDPLLATCGVFLVSLLIISLLRVPKILRIIT
jgi:surface polysaccharide O-acyltransferase-like enzyme